MYLIVYYSVTETLCILHFAICNFAFLYSYRISFPVLRKWMNASARLQ